MSIGDALDFGMEYALLAGAQDHQTEQIAAMLADREALNARLLAGAAPAAEPSQIDVRVRMEDDDDPNAAVVNALDWSQIYVPETWDDYIGQTALKRELQVAIQSAKFRGEPLPHLLLASPMAGVGKTTLAMKIAKEMNARMVVLVPPFNIYTLVKAAENLLDGDVLFIDEIHLLALKRHGAEMLLTILPDFVAYLDGEAVELNRITVIGATTEKDALQETVQQRFRIKPRWEPYTLGDLAEIAENFSARHGADAYTTPELSVAIGQACQGTPRIAEELVLAARDLGIALHRAPSAAELLDYKRIEPDGLFGEHVDYLTHLRLHKKREVRYPDGSMGYEFVAGEASMRTLLRESKQALSRIERYLIELGLLDQSPRGRRLTAAGIARAERLISEGKGARCR